MNLQINLNPQEIHGNWRAGYALDFHTVSSHLLPDRTYDTERTEIGELVFQVKYRCVLLFDDIYRSGETLTEITDVLHKQGNISHVLVLTLTQTRTKR